MRKSSRGNPFHDERGRFASKDKAAITIENTKEFYEERTERRKNVDTRNETDVRRIEERVSGGQTGIVNDKEHGRGPGNRDERHRRIDMGVGDVLRRTGVNVYPTQNSRKFRNLLGNARENNKHGCYVDVHTAKELRGMKTFISEDGQTGIAVENDGNICCAFNSNKKVSAVEDLLRTARENGGTKMDCYGSKLANMYIENGFIAVARVPYNADYVDDLGDFNKVLREEKPDVYVLMVRSKDNALITENVKQGAYGEKCLTKAELDGLPTFNDYEEALTYRDNLFNE